MWFLVFSNYSLQQFGYSLVSSSRNQPRASKMIKLIDLNACLGKLWAVLEVKQGEPSPKNCANVSVFLQHILPLFGEICFNNLTVQGGLWELKVRKEPNKIT